MKKTLISLFFVFMCSIAYGEITWEAVQDKEIAKVCLDNIYAHDPIIAKALKHKDIRNKFTKGLTKREPGILLALFLEKALKSRYKTLTGDKCNEMDIQEFTSQILTSINEELAAIDKDQAKKTIEKLIGSSLDLDDDAGYDNATLWNINLALTETFLNLVEFTNADGLLSGITLNAALEGKEKGLISEVEFDSIKDKIQYIDKIFMPNTFTFLKCAAQKGEEFEKIITKLAEPFVDLSEKIYNDYKEPVYKLGQEAYKNYKGPVSDLAKQAYDENKVKTYDTAKEFYDIIEEGANVIGVSDEFKEATGGSFDKLIEEGKKFFKDTLKDIDDFFTGKDEGNLDVECDEEKETCPASKKNDIEV